MCSALMLLHAIFNEDAVQPAFVLAIKAFDLMTLQLKARQSVGTSK